MKFIKRNIKVILTFIFTSILFTGVGVYAEATFLAKNVSFTSTNSNFKATNVEDALNQLYTNKFSSVSKQNFVGNGTTSDVLTDSFYQNYTYMKITSIYLHSGTKCEVFFQNNDGTSEQTIELNTEYNIKNMINNGYSKFSTRNNDGWCWPTIEYYN